MRRHNYFFLVIMFLFLAACEKEMVSPEDETKILEINFSETSSVTTAQEITVKIDKPTPCHYVSQVNKTTSDKTFNYDIILMSDAEVCTAVIEEEDVTVTFDPSTTGEHTLNFLINGKLIETRTVTVTE